jgi:MFS transporter, DHA1 family, solute carrier family 18 (vesicular amine transporter), member 1/2
VSRLVVAFYALLFLDEIVLLGMVPLAPTYADQLGLTETQTGLLLGAASLAPVVIAIPVGVYADRIGARRLALAGAAVLALGALGQGLTETFWILLVARVVIGIGSAVIWTAGTAWLSDSVSERRRSAALGAVMTVAGVGASIGPAYAGYVAEAMGTGAPFLIAAAGIVVVTIVLATAGRGGQAEHEPLSIRTTVRAVRREHLLIAALAITVLAGISDGVVGLLAPLQLDENGLSSGTIGAVFSLAAAAFLVGSTACVRLGDRVVTIAAAAAGCLALALAVVPLVASTETASIVAGVALRALAVALLYTISFPLTAKGALRTGVGRGAALGLVNVGWGTATLLGPLVAGALAETIGARVAYAAVIGLALGTAAWLLVVARFYAAADGVRALETVSPVHRP